ncbi:hypothetical protein OPKNFCMD_2256 [Methylobacterium crusticola]|uniref:Glycosyltransferase n=1 Tax=Methylobacterium crusticola TaxID=1697972 RepID=A0ABQ4QXS0_9HYPH|nr:glycosyltransferase family 2 protein [Methylobacterium crusticola]GJD49525.1 hypothetical protein OPKNFCMD_2256 [Methylobacterium crusticola]
MMSFAEVTLSLVACLCAIPVLTLLAEILASLPSLRPGHLAGRRPSVAVLIPAHDEREDLDATMTSVRGQLVDGDRLVVVADNCRDDTALIAEAGGAEVVVRHDPDRRGKGFALDAGLRFLARTGLPEVVVVVDADCRLRPGAIDRLAAASVALGRPVQASYLFTPVLGGSPAHRIGAFAARVRTIARPLGARRLGVPCPIMGSGFALPATCLSKVSFASGHLAEDKKLGLDLALAGFAPHFCPEAEVESPLPLGEAARHRQQTRWEHGHIALIKAYAPRLFREAFRGRDLRLLAVALDLCLPPLVGLALMSGLVLLLTAGWAGLGGAEHPMLVAGGTVGLLCLAIVLAAWRWGQGLVSWRDVLALPSFMLVKLPILVGALTKPQGDWIRTDRVRQRP